MYHLIRFPEVISSNELLALSRLFQTFYQKVNLRIKLSLQTNTVFVRVPFLVRRIISYITRTKRMASGWAQLRVICSAQGI